jgi:ectoine hydroxylase-related dioxygenase (phytanoyl-CoA dioxygenase family)
MTKMDPNIAIEGIMTSGCLARKAFIDASVQHEFEQNGYVTIPDFLDKETMADLEALYLKFSPSVKIGFHVTNWIKETDYTTEAHQKVSSVLTEKLKTILDHYKPVLGCFAVKEPGYDNTMGLHQDWSLTDESVFYGLSVWIPFVDVAQDSGALRVLKGSHRLFSNIRGQKIQNQLDDISAEVVSKYLTTVPMKAGDLLVLNHRIVHSSGPTADRRIAAMMAAIPEESKVKHYLADTNPPRLRVYDCPNDFYVTFDIEKLPPSEYETTSTQQTDLVVTAAMIEDLYNI